MRCKDIRSERPCSPVVEHPVSGSGGYTILYHTIIYYTTVYYAVLYYTILYYTIIWPGSIPGGCWMGYGYASRRGSPILTPRKHKEPLLCCIVWFRASGF